MSNAKTLSPEALAISASIRAATADQTGTDRSAGKDIYVEHAEKNGTNMEEVKRVKSYDRVFTAGVMHAAYSIGSEAVVGDPSLKETKFQVTVDGGQRGETFSGTYQGERSGVIVGKDGTPDKPWTSLGSVSGKHSVSVGKTGDIAAVIDIAAAAAAAAAA